MATKPEDQAVEGANSVPEASTSRPKMPRKPVKPDVEEHKAAVEQLQAEMNKRKARVEAIKQAIDQKKQFDGGPEFQKVKAKLNQLSSAFKAELEKKKGLRAELNALNNKRDELRAQIRDLKTKVGPYPTVQKLDDRIRQQEFEITHSSMNLKDENKAREEIKRLVALKPMTGLFAKAQDDLKSSEGTREQIMTHLKACDDKLSGIKAEEEAQRASMNEMRSKESAKSQDIPSLLKERDECREVMNALWQKIQEMREEHKARHNKHWEDMQAWQAMQKEEYRLKQIQREKEWAETTAERKAAAAEFAGEPYHKEVGLCEQLLVHLKKYQDKDKGAASPSASASASQAADKQASNAFEGMKAVKRDKDDNNGYEAFMGSGGKKGKGKKGKSTPAAATGGDQKLNHSLDMIDAFSKLKVSMPTTSSKVPAAVAEVEERKGYWLKKRAEAKETGVVTEEREEAGPSKPPKANGVARGRGGNSNTLDLTAELWPDFAGNVKAADSTPEIGSSPKGDMLVAIKLGVSGDGVLLTCTPLS